MHHLTLNYLEFEQTNTSEFSAKACKNFEEMKSLFSIETVLMQSNQNKDLFDEYKNVVAATLGRMFGKEIPAVKWMLSVFPKHYLHPNSSTASRKSLIHVGQCIFRRLKTGKFSKLHCSREKSFKIDFLNDSLRELESEI